MRIKSGPLPESKYYHLAEYLEDMMNFYTLSRVSDELEELLRNGDIEYKHYIWAKKNILEVSK